jgi:hypothetical protein
VRRSRVNSSILRDRTIHCFDGIGEMILVEVALRHPTLAALAKLVVSHDHPLEWSSICLCGRVDCAGEGTR